MNDSDGLVCDSADVKPEIVAYAESKGIPVMAYPGEEDFAASYNSFYDLIAGVDEEDEDDE